MLRCLLSLLLVAALAGPAARAGMLFDGDGSDEKGFVPPPQKPKAPPAPPANIASGETYIPYPGPPVTPMRRSEKKRPPTPPVLFVKLTSARGPLDWNSRPNDINNLLRSLKRTAGVDYHYETRPFRDISADADKNPILYRSGHFHFDFSPQERRRLREFLLNGGTIVFNAGFGSKPFYDSARRVMGEVFPEVPVQRLSPDHPVFHAYHDIHGVTYTEGVAKAGHASSEPWLEGVTIDCRTVAFISRWGLDFGWDPSADETALAYEPESARRLGLNIATYATSMRAWSKNLAAAMRFTDAPGARASGAVSIAQIMYRGEWKTRHAGLSVLLNRFNKSTGVPVKFERKDIRLTDPALYDSPMIYLTGHEDFILDAAETETLRRYLENGGLLFAEACCGREGFDRAFRAIMARALPNAPLRAVPKGHPLLTTPNALDTLPATPALAARHTGARDVAPLLFTAEIRGRTAVIYSPCGLAGGWEFSPSPYAFGYEDEGALRLGENILMHAVAH